MQSPIFRAPAFLALTDDREVLYLPILRLTHLLPLVIISAEAQPTRTFPFLRATRCNILISRLPCLPCESDSCSVPYRRPSCNAQAPDFILPPTLGTAEVATSKVRRLCLPIVAHVAHF